MNTRARNRILLGMGGLVAIGVAFIAWPKKHEQPATPQANAITTPARTEPTRDGQTDEPTDIVSRDPGCTFAPGSKLAYALETIVQTKIDTAQAKIDPSISDMPALTRASRATLVMRALSGDAQNGAVLLARLQDVDTATSKAAGDITPPFLVRIDKDCAVRGYARLATTPIREARAAQAMLHELSFSWAQDGESTGAGQNVYGAYAATYSASKGPTIVRRIRTYTQAWEDAWARGLDVDEPSALIEHTPLASEMTVRAGRGPWFETLQSFERMPGVLASETETRTNAKRIGDRDAALDGQPTDGSRYVWENLLPRKVKPRETEVMSSRERKELDKLKTVSTADAMKKFLGRVEAGENISTQWPELSQWLRARPEMTKEVAKKLRGGEIPDGATAAVYLALGKTPTTEARDELLAINGDTSAPTMDRARAAFSLVDREDVGIDFARSLHRDSQAVSTGRARMDRIYGREATLALGMMAGLKGEEHPEIMAESRDATVEILRAGKDSATLLRPAFKAVANMGDVSMLATVSPYMAHPDPLVRRGATISIRRMAPSKTASLTTSWLARERDPEVKRSLYHVVQLQHHDAQAIASPEIVAQAIADLDARPGTLTRQSLVRILGTASTTIPEARAALLRHVKNEVDAKQGIEELMSKYLTAAEMSAAVKGAQQ